MIFGCKTQSTDFLDHFFNKEGEVVRLAIRSIWEIRKKISATPVRSAPLFSLFLGAILLTSTHNVFADTYGPNSTGTLDVAVNDIQASTVAATLVPLVSQSFESGLDGVLSEIDVFSNGPTVTPDVIAIDIYVGDGLSGSLLGSMVQQVGPGVFDPALGGYPVRFDLLSLDIQVDSGSTYTFSLTSVVAGDITNNGILANDQDIYLGGQAFGGGLPPSGDLYFQTFVAAELLEAGVLPLFCGSLIGLAFVARRSPRRRPH